MATTDAELGDRVPVCTKALVVRINRALKTRAMQLMMTRGTRLVGELGKFYVVDLQSNAISDRNVELEPFARVLGVMKAFEAHRD